MINGDLSDFYGNLWKYHLSTRNGGLINGFIWENHGNMSGIYPLIMTNIAMVFRWSIEIDGLPFLKVVDLSMAMLNSQMVSIYYT